MKASLKNEILEYLKANNDGSETAKHLISEMEYEVCFADVDAFSVSTDDLMTLDGSSIGNTLREKLGKGKKDEYNIEDCIRVAEAMADFCCEEYSENLYNTIEYEL